MDGVAERLADVRRRISRAGGAERDVTVVAVTKGFPHEVVGAALAAGLHDLGENYAQSLMAKAKQGLPARWHLIGAIQRRKVARLAPFVHLWQSVARPEEGDEIARRAPGAAVLVQVNLSGEPQRNGCSWDEAPVLVDALQARGLEVRGLMGMASREEPRPQFRRLAALAAGVDLPEVSMGMSEDFEVAVEEGATMVRLGTALFGPRRELSDLRR